MSGGLGSKSKSKNKNRVQIPSFLQPFLESSASIGGSTLAGLNDRLGNATADDLVADFSTQELLAQILGTERALGGGDFFPVAQDAVLSAARGQSIDDYLPADTLSTLRSAQSGGLGFLPDSVRSRLDQGMQSRNLAGTDYLDQAAGAATPGSVIDALTRSRATPGTDTLAQLLQSGGTPEQTRETLEATARGDYLFGGQGFDQAVQAAVNAATPQILSVFGRAGPGGATGALAQESVGRAAIDAFASQFGSERGRQLGAAESLAALGRADRGQSADIASTLADLGLSSGAQEIDAAQILGGLSQADAGRRADIGSALAGLDLNQSSQQLNFTDLLSRLAENSTTRGLGSAELLANLGFGERSNQLNAAEALPGLATADLDLLLGLGGQRRELDQQRLSAPIDAQLRLLQAALSGLPISSLLGSNQSSRNSGLQLGF